MKSIRPKAALFILFLLALQPLTARELPRVSIVPFEAAGSLSQEDARALTVLFETAIIESKVFQVLKQGELQEVIDSQSFSLSDLTDPKYAVKLGKLMAANRLFTGKLIALGKSFSLTVQLIDIETGEILQAEKATAESPEELSALIPGMANRFVLKSDIKVPEFTGKTKIYVDMGDRFLSDGNFGKAAEQYEKALKDDEFNPHLLKKIITTRTRDILSRSIYNRDMALRAALDVALRDDYWAIVFVPDEELDALLEQSLFLKTLEPSMEEDPELLFAEVQLLKVGNRITEAIEILEGLTRRMRGNPDYIAELGLLQGYLANWKKRKPMGADLLRKAIEMDPENPLFYHYLGRTLSRGKQVDPEIIRAYRKAAELAKPETDFPGKNIFSYAAQSLQRYYYFLGSLEGGILTPELEMPAPERLDHLEFLKREGIRFYSSTATRSMGYYLGTLYFATGQYKKAAETTRELMGEKRDLWKRRTEWLKLYQQILTRGGHDKKTLDEVNRLLKEVEGQK